MLHGSCTPNANLIGLDGPTDVGHPGLAHKDRAALV